MAVGLSAVNLADAWLNVMRGGGAGTTFTAPSTIYVQLHTSAGEPGSAGTSNVSTAGSRQAITFGASAAVSTTRAITSSNAPQWTNWAGTNGEVIRYVSFWSASSAGTFYWSAQLTVDKTIGTGDTVTLTSGATTLSLTPIAA